MTKFIKLELTVSREGLKINGKEYKANIQFDNNEIIVCNETKENADWFIEFLDDPMNFKKYIVDYQDKTYELLPESLLTIIIYKFKKEMKEVINSFELIVENDEDTEMALAIRKTLKEKVYDALVKPFTSLFKKKSKIKN